MLDASWHPHLSHPPSGVTTVLKRPHHTSHPQHTTRTHSYTSRASALRSQVEYVKGWGKLADANTVEVALADGSTRKIKTKNIILATGSEVTPMPGITIDEEK